MRAITLMIVMILKNNKSSLITQIIKRNIKKAVNKIFVILFIII